MSLVAAETGVLNCSPTSTAAAAASTTTGDETTNGLMLAPTPSCWFDDEEEEQGGQQNAQQQRQWQQQQQHVPPPSAFFHHHHQQQQQQQQCSQQLQSQHHQPYRSLKTNNRNDDVTFADPNELTIPELDSRQKFSPQRQQHQQQIQSFHAEQQVLRVATASPSSHPFSSSLSAAAQSTPAFSYQSQQQQQSPSQNRDFCQDPQYHHSKTQDSSCEQQQQQKEQHQNHYLLRNTQLAIMPRTHPAPSWKEISCMVPSAARELLSASVDKVTYTARLSYAQIQWHRKYSEMGNPAAGYLYPTCIIQNSLYNNNNNNDDDNNNNNNSSAKSTTTNNNVISVMNSVTGLSNETAPAHSPAPILLCGVAPTVELPPFSSLSWVERQLVQEWRTFHPEEEATTNEIAGCCNGNNGCLREKDTHIVNTKGGKESYNYHNYGNSTTQQQYIDDDDDDILEPVSSKSDDEDEKDQELAVEMEGEESSDEFERARTLVPVPVERPVWQRTEVCYTCHMTFGPTRLRHHCRMCGKSVCQSHASYTHKLPHLGYDPNVPERVCDPCKAFLLEQNLAERVAWRLARCRDFSAGQLRPYFETGVDTVEEAAWRVTQAALTMAKSIPLGAQASVAVETVDVLRRHGLNGIYTILLRQEFLAAADLLRKALGINRTSWPLSVHELSAAIFYALAQHRAMRGMYPEREHLIHSFRTTTLTKGENAKTTAASSYPNFLTRIVATAKCQSPAVESESLSDAAKPSAVSSVESEPLSPVITYEIEKEISVDELLREPTIQTCSNGATSESNAERFGPTPQVPPQENAGSNPLFQPVCDPVSDATVASLIFYAPMALNFIYQEKEVDMQLLAAQQGWRLIYAQLEQDARHKQNERPASALFVHEDQKLVCLAIRGTATIHDVITDIRHTPVPFPDSLDAGNGKSEKDMDAFTVMDESDGDQGEAWTTIFRGHGLAVCGMATAATNLYREHIDSILWFARRGYRVRLTGHSLGGGVASLLGLLVYRDLERFDLVNDNNCVVGTGNSSENGNCNSGDISDSSLSSNVGSPLRVYAYGTPSCVDGRLAECVTPFVTTVVLHDDVVPRLTPASCRGLLKHLLHIRETWVKEHFTDDIMAITERAKTAWAPRWRGSFTLSKSSSSLKRYCRKQIQNGKRKILSVKHKIATEISLTTGTTMNDSMGRDRSDSNLGIIVEDGTVGESSHDLTEEEDNELMDQEQRPVLDIMGGMDTRSAGVIIDGEEFFESAESLVEEGDSESECDDNVFDDIAGKSSTQVGGGSNGKVPPPKASGDPAPMVKETDNSVTPGAAVVLEEAPLPRMFIPGRVVHIYSHRGVYRAACVPRNFRELRRISMAGNCLDDHKTKSYYEALLEIRSVRNAAEDPPQWTAFDEDNTCSCCASRFTWASTSDSEAQEARDKHNCRSCGSLVCDPCSKNRIPMPSIGITVACRVCDRCYNDVEGLFTTPSGLTSSFMANKEVAATPDSYTHKIVEKPVRQRGRRSCVVDEFASRIQTSALTCS